MKVTFKTIVLTASVFSLTAAAGAATTADNLFPDLHNRSRSAEIRARAARSPETARALLTEAQNGGVTPEDRCAAIEALADVKNEQISKGLADLLNDNDSSVRACAIRSAGESRNAQAEEVLIATIEDYLAQGESRGQYDVNMKLRLKAIDSIWSLGEIGNPNVMAKLSKYYNQSDPVLRINIIISIGKLKTNRAAAPYLVSIAGSETETNSVRAAAFEMLEKVGWTGPVPSLTLSKLPDIEKADMIYTGGITGSISGWVSPDLPIGHAGLFLGTEVRNGKIKVIIADCVPDFFKPGGVRNIDTWENFTHQFMYPYYGNTTTPVKPTAGQRTRIAAMAIAMGKKGLTYSDTHMSQKGPTLFDCVGYTEYLYEQAGLNPTDNSFETGMGWPLTPYEQFAATRLNLPAKAGAPAAASAAKAPDQGIITGGAASLTKTFGMEGVQVPLIAADIQPETAD
jgi:hypothetical protein